MSEKIIKGYGSIPHLSTSKLNQQADKKITQGQEDILTKKARDWKDLIIVTEKLDGSNVAITKKDGQIVTVGRSGYNTLSSPYDQHKQFDKYVKLLDREYSCFDFLPEGWKICGEWLYMVHGTHYDLTGKPPFVVFDIIDSDKNRLPYLDMLKLCVRHMIQTVPLLHIGQPISIKNAVKLLGDGHYGNIDPPEGLVYRVERDGKIDFLAKHVRADKEDGKYMHLNKKQKGVSEYI